MSPSSAGSGSSGSSSAFSEVFVAEEGDVVAHKGLGDATTVTVQTLLETLLEDICTLDCFL
jgi:hypothetical protein